MSGRGGSDRGGGGGGYGGGACVSTAPETAATRAQLEFGNDCGDASADGYGRGGLRVGRDR